MWTRQDIDNKLNQLRDTSNLWPTNPIPLRAELTYYCSNKKKKYIDMQPCVLCDGRDPEKIWGSPCKFWQPAPFRPIVAVWQLEYIIPIEIIQLKIFLRDDGWLCK